MKMAKSKEQYEKEIIEHIKKDKDICFISEIFIEYSGCSRQTFYHLGLDKSDKIGNIIESNRTSIKKEMRGNWKKKEANAALQASAYKLMGTDEERKRLSQTYTELTGKGGGPIKYSDMSEEELDKKIKELSGGK